MSDFKQLADALRKSPRGAIPVFKDPNVPLTRTAESGETIDAFFWMIDGKILVHPDRWDAFQMAINQPDVFAHPEVFAMFGLRPTPRAGRR